jgi:YhcH/YjgK/YiaL family protein
MVIDTLAHAANYQMLGPCFAAGLKWLQTFQPSMPDGRYDIEGDEVFALVQSYDTMPASEKKYESHRLYADIQYVATGTEIIHYTPTAGLQPETLYDGEKDFLLYAAATADTSLHLPPGSFAIFYPQDGHKPGCVSVAPCRMKKVVIKVRI